MAQLQFYKTNKENEKIIDPDLFDKTAKSFADSFFGENVKGMWKEKTGVSITQLRRLFDEVKRFQQILEVAAGKNHDKCWDEQLPYIKMIKSKVSYTMARMAKSKPQAGKYYNNLSNFISQGIDLVKTKEDYFVFTSLFEAVYGFYYENAPKE